MTAQEIAHDVEEHEEIEGGQLSQTPAPTKTPVGRTSATERDPSTSDKFQFWLTGDVIVNPFDIVEVKQVHQPGEGASKTFGLVTILEHRTDAPNHLANFISSNFGDLTEQANTPRQGTTVGFVNVLSNDADIYMPVPSEEIVYFADREGIEKALGIDQMEMENRIPAGLIKMSNEATAVAYIDRRYVLGPESAHVNISGISGLATKTSYGMFLIQAILQTTRDPSKIAVIIINVKQADLLQIHRRPEKRLPAEHMARWEALGLEARPFENVTYLLPRGDHTPRTGRPNSFLEPDVPYQVYAYDLESTADKLDLLFSNISDPTGTMEQILGDIIAGIRANEYDFRNIHSWHNLLYQPPLYHPDDPKGKRIKAWREHHVASIGKFRRHLRRLVETRQTGIFTQARATGERVLSQTITNIKGGHTYVVDIAKLADDEQTLVLGDLLRTVYALKAEEVETRDKSAGPIPEKIIFFVDELNKYAPRGVRTSPISEQVLEIAERGRSLEVILISAQQFMSAVHDRVTGNAATKILGRTGSAEVMHPDYRFLDQEIKMSVTRLSKGELLLSHAVYRQPVKMIFPLPAYRQQEL